MPTLVKVVNRYPNAIEFRGQRPSETVLDAQGKPILDTEGKLQFRHYPMQSIQLEHGAHAADVEVLSYILENNDVCQAIFDRHCSIEDDAPEGGAQPYTEGSYVGDLSKLTIAGASAAIRACSDPAQLAQWLMQDARAPVKKALHLRDRDLRPADGENL